MVGLIKYILLLTSLTCYSQQHIIIGDSQTLYLSNQATQLKRVKELCKGGIGITILNEKVKAYPISIQVKTVTVCIGVNDCYRDKGVRILVQNINKKFPNAKIYAVQGSWGWGGVSKMNQKNLDTYYKLFESLNCIIISPAIGEGDPHANKESYKIIIKNIENRLIR